MERLYTDIDEVLHDYRNLFFLTLEGVVGDKIDPDTLPSEQDLRTYFQETYGMSLKEFDDIIDFLNNITIWNPTDFSEHIIKYLKENIDQGKEVIAVTARTSRRGAREIIETIFGETIPLISCDAKFKKHIIKGNTVFFEDRADTARSVVQENPEALVIVPKWPWNENVKDEQKWDKQLTAHQSERIWHVHQSDMKKTIERIEDAKSGLKPAYS
jgi:hypothetical protein